MNDVIDRAAEVLTEAWEGRVRQGISDEPRGHCHAFADALADAGLLAKYPRLEIEGGWLIEVVDYHTCGAGPGSGAGHEPGCGSIPVARLVTPEHDAAVAAGALREAATDVAYAVEWEDVPESVESWLHDCADRLEREAGESDADA